MNILLILKIKFSTELFLYELFIVLGALALRWMQLSENISQKIPLLCLLFCRVVFLRDIVTLW